MGVEEGALEGSRTLEGHLREGCTERNLERWRFSEQRWDSPRNARRMSV